MTCQGDGVGRRIGDKLPMPQVRRARGFETHPWHQDLYALLAWPVVVFLAWALVLGELLMWWAL